MVDPHPRGGGDRRFGAEGNAHSRFAQHRKIIGAIAHGHGCACRQVGGFAKADKRFALGFLAEDRLCHTAGEPAALDFEDIGVVLVKADHFSNTGGEEREPARHERGACTVCPHGLHQLAAARRQADAVPNDILDDCFRKTSEKRDPLTQGRLEGNLAAHGAFGNRRHMCFQADEIGKFVNAFLTNHGGIHIGEEKRLAPPLRLLHDDVDGRGAQRLAQALFGQRNGIGAGKRKFDSQSRIKFGRLAGFRQNRPRLGDQRGVQNGRGAGGNKGGDVRGEHGGLGVSDGSIDAVLLAGPTASGKSALALEIARRCHGVVINADSMQVYRDLRIITARPSMDEEAMAPHDLYGHVDAAVNYSVGRWVLDAETAIKAARAAGGLPILIGGTGLYFKAAERGLAAMPAVPAAVREAIRQQAEGRTPQSLHADLAAVDPASAARLRTSDPQRILRALEVFAATGRSLTEWQQEPHSPPLIDPHRALRLFLAPERAALYGRIDARFDTMVSDGALEEVARLGQRGLDPALPAMRAHGVPWLLKALAGDIAIDLAIAHAKADTRHYAKRQFTWFRHQMPGWRFLDPAEAALAVREMTAR